MCALLRVTAVTTVYQRDSSSKRPRSSVVSAARAPEMSRSEHGIQGFAPCGRRLRRPWTPGPRADQKLLCEQADACPRTAKATFTERAFINVIVIKCSDWYQLNEE